MTPLKRPFVTAVGLLLVSTACQQEEPTHSSEVSSAEPPSNRVEIPSTVRKNLGITFAKVERRKVAETIRVPGRFELQPLARREYRLMLPGVIEFSVKQLEEIRPGMLLYRFRSTKWLELQAQIHLAEATLQQRQTKLDAVSTRLAALRGAAFKRADLEAQFATLSADVTKAEAEFDEATLHAVRTLNLCGAYADQPLTSDDLLAHVEQNGKSLPFYRTIDQIEVRATEPGVVENLALTDGVYAAETSLVITTVNPRMVRFQAQGLQSDLYAFSSNASVHIVPPQALGAKLNESVDAILQVGLEADPTKRTITLLATPNRIQPWIRPGVSAFMEVVTDSTSSPVLAIPRSAVVKDGINHVFFKRDPRNANKAIRIEADLGVNDGRWIEVKSDIGPNDEVVLDGAYELKLATSESGTSQKGGHFHADGTYHGDH